MVDRTPQPPRNTVVVRRVTVENFRSIARCEVELLPLTFLVGPNGAGKSNFLDVMRLVADALRSSLAHVLRDRGGIDDVCRRAGVRSPHFALRLDLTLPGGDRGHYALQVGATSRSGFEIQREECVLGPAWFDVVAGSVRSSAAVHPPASSDRLYLVNAAGLPAFRPVYDSLSRMGFYNLHPEVMRTVQPLDPSPLLARDGLNLASTLDRMAQHDPQSKRRVEEFLATVVPGLEGVDANVVEHAATVVFKQRHGATQSCTYHAGQQSDGTLRALGLLIALFQKDDQGAISLVGLEEPEAAMHPGAVGALLGALREASLQTQVLVTTHSPDLLDDESVTADSLRAVVAQEGATLIAPIDVPSQSALRDHLYTAGELLRLNQLSPELEGMGRLGSRKLQFFDNPGRE